MKTKYKPNYRPGSYWRHEDPLDAILEGVKGQSRRDAIRRAWNQGDLENLSDLVLKGNLKEEERISLGKLNPSLMGGEYLPDFEPGETTIARIFLQSVTSDVIELRAKPRPEGKIHLRWVDEYKGTSFQYDKGNEFELPLTFIELVNFIDKSQCESVPLPLGFNMQNVHDAYEVGEEAANTLRNFTSVSSPFYPQLNEYYQDQADAEADQYLADYWEEQNTTF